MNRTRTVVRLGMTLLSMVIAPHAFPAANDAGGNIADKKVDAIPGARTPLPVGNNWTEREAPRDAHVFLYGRHSASSSAMPAGILGIRPNRSQTGPAKPKPDAREPNGESD